MAHYHQDWDDLGRSIEDIVDRAVNSSDYQKLNQTIRQVVERAVDVSSGAAKKAVQTAAARRQNRPEIIEEKKDLSLLYGNPSKHTAGGILRIVGGSLALAGVLTGSIVSLVLSAMFDITFGAFGGLLSLGVLGGGGWLIGSGVGKLNRVSRFKTYRKTLGSKTYCTLEKLARSVGKPIKFVKKELQQLIEGGLFPEGHLDAEETMLITSHETWRYFEQSRLQLEARKEQESQEQARLQEYAANQDPRVREVLDKGNAFIAQIRRCNDLIPGEEISRKISRMEDIVRRIFQRVEADPDVIPDTKKLMDYYLPMTVKLLNAYADMDAQAVQGENILASKREIEQTLDTLNLAFEKLLDDLFEETALDISSDISVLQTLLAQEGLTEDELSKMRKNNGGN